MARILFLTLSYPVEPNNRTIYTDLMDELANRGNDIIVLRPNELRSSGTIDQVVRNNIRIISVPTGKVTKVTFVIKAINTLLLEGRYRRTIKKVGIPDINLLLYSTPPITFSNLIKSLKNKYGCINCLLLKDIFPQNAVDLGILSKKSILWYFLRRKEKALYKRSDYIGCMSPANAKYVCLNNKEVRQEIVHIFPNSIRPEKGDQQNVSDEQIMEEHHLSDGSLRMVYGGNLGRPQGIDFLIEVITRLEKIENVSLHVVGSGTEFEKVKKLLFEKDIKNTVLLPSLEKPKYLELLSVMDVGLIFLDCRFSIPNFPSRILDYMDKGLPILACTDINSDIKEEICDLGAGFWIESGKIDDFITAVELLKVRPDLRIVMGKKSREVLESKYDVRKVVDDFLATFLKKDILNGDKNANN